MMVPAERELWDWCVVHRSMSTELAPPHRHCFAVSVGHGEVSDCDIRPFRLVPRDALVLVRDADGQWPEWIYDAWPDCPDEGHIAQDVVLDALAEADNPQ